MSKERPILFSGEMVRALLAGTKTQTRRVVTVHWHKGTRALPYEPWFVEEDGRLLVDCSERDDSHGNGDYREFSSCMACPYGAPGDRLWVRETFADEPGGPDEYPRVVYRADRAGRYYDATSMSAVFYLESDYEPTGGARWKPSIFMPRRFSRITVEITSVRVERVQDISEDDARAEGVRLGEQVPATINGKPGAVAFFDPRAAYAYLWNAINGKRHGCSWEANPWVWALTFRRVEPQS